MHRYRELKWSLSRIHWFVSHHLNSPRPSARQFVLACGVLLRPSELLGNLKPDSLSGRRLLASGMGSEGWLSFVLALGSWLPVFVEKKLH